MPVKKIHFNKNGQVICRQNSTTSRFKLESTNNEAAITCRMCLDILAGKINLCRFASAAELPERAFCLQCETEKPIGEMMVAFLKKEKLFRVRPRCKACNNERERGNRREYKRKYLKKWRKRNDSLNRSYWKDNPHVKERSRINAARQREKKGDAMAIQQRMRNRGFYLSLSEAGELLAIYGRCYPTRAGLSKKGLAECERIRSRLRRSRRASYGAKMPTNFEIRLMVYEDGLEDVSLLIQPELQPEKPYDSRAENMRKYWRRVRVSAAA